MTSKHQPAQDRPVYTEFGNCKSERDPTPLALSRPDLPDLPVAQQDLRVQASRKGRKGKTVTIVSGFQAKVETLTELAKKLKAQCGAGGTVKDNQIEIQGDHCQQLVQVLSQLGYKVKVSGG